jgi:hypothetical protein
MDVDSAQVAGAAPSGKTVTLSSQPAGNHLIAVTPYNPYPRTPRGVKIVERAKRMSPSLIAAPDRAPITDRVPSLSQFATDQIVPVSGVQEEVVPRSPRTASPARGRPNMLKRTASRSSSASGRRAASPVVPGSRSSPPRTTGGTVDALASTLHGAVASSSSPTVAGLVQGQVNSDLLPDPAAAPSPLSPRSLPSL